MGIARVVLYKHGVGYFERIEEVEGDAEIRLSFKASEMNDVLKSLSLVDAGGGTVQSVSYDTSKPVEKLLSEVALDIPAQGGAGALLGKIRGAAVAITVGNKRHEGRVVGLEPMTRESADGVVTSQRLTVLDANGSLLSFDLGEVVSAQFLDEAIRKDLAYFFDTLIHSYKRDAKNLIVHARGKGKRKVHVRYAIETPVWKTSYRILLPENEKQKPFLEGYALVDNTQDEDWSDVELSLVAGLPISFVHDLYSPRFIHRKEVEVERESVAGPVMAEEAFAAFDMPAADMAFGAAAPPPPAPAPASMMMAPRSAPTAMLQRQQAKQRAAQTIAQSVGDLFQYRLRHPVTVHRNQSALVPIAADEFEGRRVVLYNRTQRAENPFAAVELKNTTGLTLEGGPLVVSEGDTYAGEAMLDTLKPNDRRIVPYAVDLGVVVESEHDSRVEDVSFIRVANGWMELHSARIETRVYKLKNKDKKAKVCWLEHPIGAGGKLFDTADPEETTASNYRFLVRLSPQQITTFTVKERFDNIEYEGLSNLGRPRLEHLVQARYLNPTQAEWLRPIVDLAESLNKLTNKLNESGNLRQRLAQDQQRLRDNLRSLGSSADEGRLRTRYVEKLEQQENELETLDERIQKLQLHRSERELELNDAIAKITFEVVIGAEPTVEQPPSVEEEPPPPPEPEPQPDGVPPDEEEG